MVDFEIFSYLSQNSIIPTYATSKDGDGLSESPLYLVSLKQKEKVSTHETWTKGKCDVCARSHTLKEVRRHLLKAMKVKELHSIETTAWTRFSADSGGCSLQRAREWQAADSVVGLLGRHLSSSSAAARCRW
jgi:hypothetical protein